MRCIGTTLAEAREVEARTRAHLLGDVTRPDGHDRSDLHARSPRPSGGSQGLQRSLPGR
ncbi:MAG TPA: hypothetical protein QF626_01935 [Prochlorococcaceae cyanobacterium Fu_MAG_50]|nr:hypothetical protein [Prochlorococcaceae cyanobacterium Fu_MAG_50]